MIPGIKAIAFDIDGTLYADWSLYRRMPFYFIRHLKFFICFNKVRNQLHKTAPLGDFYEYQARLLGFVMKEDAKVAKEKINRICYKGLEKYFKRIKPYRNAVNAVKAFKDAGYKIAVLSDFPPEQKGDIWGIRQLCDVCIGSEESGALKPSLYPFGIMAQKLGVKPEEILYVGNSKRCDVKGAKNAGMKSAYLLTGFEKLFNKKYPMADFSFRNYRQLMNIVLQ